MNAKGTKKVVKKTKKTLVKTAKKTLVKKTKVAKKMDADVLEKELEAACIELSKISTDIVADDPNFIPQYATEDSVCADLVANLPNGTALIQHRAVVIIDCGFSMAVPKGYKAEIVARYDKAAQGLIVANGILESGRVKVVLINVGHVNPVMIKHGEAFAQISITMVNKFDWKKNESTN